MGDSGVYNAWMSGHKSFNPNIQITIGIGHDLLYWKQVLRKLRKKIHYVTLDDGAQRCFIFNKDIVRSSELWTALDLEQNRHLFQVLETD